jgi:hypothetical protein
MKAVVRRNAGDSYTVTIGKRSFQVHAITEDSKISFEEMLDLSSMTEEKDPRMRNQISEAVQDYIRAELEV